ncbi:MAG: hypothetical protein ACRD6W_09825 [Nitrososphaerales archaeon]
MDQIRDLHGNPIPVAPLTSERRQEILDKFAQTAEGRGMLAVATFGPAQVAMEAVTNDHNMVVHADNLIRQMEKIQALMKGDEDYDRRKFGSLLEGLKMLSEEIHGVRRAGA